MAGEVALQSAAQAKLGCALTRAVATAAVGALWLATGGSARAQTRDDIGLGTRRGLAEEAPARTARPQDGKESPFEFSFSTGFATDYIYRGTTLSARQPAVGSAVEVAFSSCTGRRRHPRQAAERAGRPRSR